jgi:hypothetical protein
VVVADFGGALHGAGAAAEVVPVGLFGAGRLPVDGAGFGTRTGGGTVVGATAGDGAGCADVGLPLEVAAAALGASATVVVLVAVAGSPGVGAPARAAAGSGRPAGPAPEHAATAVIVIAASATKTPTRGAFPRPPEHTATGTRPHTDFADPARCLIQRSTLPHMRR